MQHVVGVETVVAKVVVDNLVSREIGAERQTGAEPLHSKEQRGLRTRVSLETVLEMTHRTDGEDYLQAVKLML